MQKGNQQFGWNYQGQAIDNSGTATNVPAPKPSQGTVTWSASEFIEHEKSAGWYLVFVLVVVAILGVVFLLTRDFISISLLGVLAVTFGVFASRKPRVLNYKLDSKGITIGQKFYPISLFRSFAVLEEGPFRSVNLLPLKRFMPPISLYYAPDDEQDVLSTFASLLPQEVKEPDALDRFMHRIRF